MPELKLVAQAALFTGFHEDDGAPTPAVAQYIEIKNANTDWLIFYRTGDLYELLCEDAVTGADSEENYGLAWLDPSTGDFHVSESALGTLQSDVARIGPREILLPDTLYDDKQVRAALEGKAALTPLPSAIADSSVAERKLL